MIPKLRLESLVCERRHSPSSGCRPHRSRGSFRSSVEEIMADTSAPSIIPHAAHALRQSPHPALHVLSIEETETAIVITGRVTSYYLKQLAQEAVMPVRGERQLVNRVIVERE